MGIPSCRRFLALPWYRPALSMYPHSSRKHVSSRVRVEIKCKREEGTHHVLRILGLQHHIARFIAVGDPVFDQPHRGCEYCGCSWGIDTNSFVLFVDVELTNELDALYEISGCKRWEMMERCGAEVKSRTTYAEFTGGGGEYMSFYTSSSKGLP